MNYIGLLETTENTRELGGIKTVDGSITKINRFWRSDVQYYPSHKDKELLISKGIKTILDIRTINEIENKPSGFTNDANFNYINIPLSNSSIKVETTRDIINSYMDIIHNIDLIKEIFLVFASNNGIMFNCTAGKDRTGVISALLLMLVNVDDNVIAENYELTKQYSIGRLKRVQEKYPDIEASIIYPQKENMLEFIKLFKEEYGDIERYLLHIGVSKNDILNIKNKLLY